MTLRLRRRRCAARCVSGKISADSFDGGDIASKNNVAGRNKRSIAARSIAIPPVAPVEAYSRSSFWATSVRLRWPCSQAGHSWNAARIRQLANGAESGGPREAHNHRSFRCMRYGFDHRCSRAGSFRQIAWSRDAKQRLQEGQRGRVGLCAWTGNASEGLEKG
jgi:hypothetical protein